MDFPSVMYVKWYGYISETSSGKKMVYHKPVITF